MSRLPPGTRPSPNIWHHTTTYEVWSRALDPDGRIDAALAEVAPWAGRDLLDVGCGTGFHLPRYAAIAGSVVGIEPHPDLAAIARRRARRAPQVRVLAGTAQDLPLPDRSADVAIARWAYFFGPGCEPGLAELDRVLRPGGAAAVVDTDPTRSTFGRWFAAGFPEVDPEAVARFWADRGWRRTPVDVRLVFDTREDLEAVLRIELPRPVAEAAIAEHAGLEVDQAVDVWSQEV